MLAISSTLPSGGSLYLERAHVPFHSRLDGLILAIGSDRLGPMLFDLLHTEFAVEHAVIARKLGNGPVEFLFAENAHGAAMTRDLCSRYGGYYHRRDPLLAALGPAQRRELLMCSLDLSDIRDLEYRSRFFQEPDFAGKVSIISRTPEQLLYLNFYRRRQDGPFRDSELWHLQSSSRLVAAIAERHFSLTAPACCSFDTLIETLRSLTASARLSEREIATCARIAMGCPMDQIARDMRITKNSAVTYRRRAFTKLNIKTHKDLFALVLRIRHRAC